MDEDQPLGGKVCLVTGATSGHGRAVARALAGLGAELVLLGRDRDRCRQIQEEIAKENRGRQPQVLLCDLSAREQIDRAASEFLAMGRPLHVLMNNAGLVSRTRRESLDGAELTLAVNYLAAFQLTLRLLPRLKQSAPARIVNVSSDMHRLVSMDLDNLELRKDYSWWTAYSRSKLALVYFTQELARRLNGSGVTVNAMDPGPLVSRIASNTPGLLAAAVGLVIRCLFPSAERAARTAVYLAWSPEVDGVSGGYFKYRKPKLPRFDGRDAFVGQRLWEISERMTGVGFPGYPNRSTC